MHMKTYHICHVLMVFLRKIAGMLVYQDKPTADKSLNPIQALVAMIIVLKHVINILYKTLVCSLEQF